MKNWKSKLRNSLLKYSIISVVLILLSLINNSWQESISYGIILGFVFTLLGWLENWGAGIMKKDFIQKLKKNRSFKSSGFQIVDDKFIIGEIQGYSIKLHPNVKGDYELFFDLTIDLSNKRQISNYRNVKIALSKLKFELEGSKLRIPIWKPFIWNYRNWVKMEKALKKIIEKLEGQRKVSQNVK